MLIVGYVLISAVTMGSYWMTLVSGGFTPQAIDAASRSNLAQFESFSPMMIVQFLLSAASGAATYALWAGSVGTATLELRGTSAIDYAATFD